MEPSRSARPDHQVQRLLWAVGEAHHRRRARREASGGPGPARPAGGLELSTTKRGRRLNVSVVGCLDGAGAAQFSASMRAWVGAGARSVVVDLGSVAVVDARGVQALQLAAGLLEAHNGELVLKAPRAGTLHLLELVGPSSTFHIC